MFYCSYCGTQLKDARALYELEVSKILEFDDGREKHPVNFEIHSFCNKTCALSFYQEAFLDAKRLERKFY